VTIRDKKGRDSRPFFVAHEKEQQQPVECIRTCLWILSSTENCRCLTFRWFFGVAFLVRIFDGLVKLCLTITLVVMKNVVFVFAVLFGVILSNIAVVSAGTETPYEMDAQEEKVKIKPEELPAAVRTTLQSEDYTGWTIDNAYKYPVSGTFEVQMKKGGESRVFKFDKDGKKIE